MQLTIDTQALQELRLAGGYTQRALAAKAGISRASYQSAEQGKRNPRISTINKIADALDVPRGKFTAVEVVS